MAKHNLHPRAFPDNRSSLLRFQRGDPMQEKVGFGVMTGGLGTWFSSSLSNLDLGQIVGILIAVVGIVLQILAFIRNSRESKLTQNEIKARMKRDEDEHLLKMEALKKDLKDSK